MDDSNGQSLKPWLSYLWTQFFLAFLIIFKWSHVYVCKDLCWRDWGFLEGLSTLGLLMFFYPFKEYFQRLKTGQFWGHVQWFFDRRFWGLGVNGSKLYIVHWFHVKPKWVLELLWNLGTFKRKFPPLLRVTGSKNVNTYSIAIQFISYNIGSPKIYDSSIYMCVCIWIIRENYSGNSLKAVIFFCQIFATLQCFWEKTWTVWSVKCCVFCHFRWNQNFII
jgi:hypothetical protein